MQYMCTPKEVLFRLCVHCAEQVYSIQVPTQVMCWFNWFNCTDVQFVLYRWSQFAVYNLPAADPPSTDRISDGLDSDLTTPGIISRDLEII